MPTEHLFDGRRGHRSLVSATGWSWGRTGGQALAHKDQSEAAADQPPEKGAQEYGAGYLETVSAVPLLLPSGS